MLPHVQVAVTSDEFVYFWGKQAYSQVLKVFRHIISDLQLVYTTARQLSTVSQNASNEPCAATNCLREDWAGWEHSGSTLWLCTLTAANSHRTHLRVGK